MWEVSRGKNKQAVNSMLKSESTQGAAKASESAVSGGLHGDCFSRGGTQDRRPQCGYL